MMNPVRTTATAPPVVEVASGDPHDVRGDVLVVGAFTGGIEGPGVAAVLDGLGLASLPVTPEFRGDIGQHLLVAGSGLPWATVLFVGLGRMVATDARRLRDAAAVAAASGHLRGRVVTTLALVHPTTAAIGALAEGFHLGRPRRASPDGGTAPAHITILAPTAVSSDAERAVHRATTVAHATIAARDLVDTPPNRQSPTVLARQMIELTSASCGADLHDHEALRTAGFQGTLSAGRGAPDPPCLLELRYEPSEPLGHVVLCGRGTTFGSGGLSLRRGTAMDGGKADMAGAAAIAGACSVLADLDVRVRVTALLGLVESMPGGDAQRPGDVVTTRGGLTVEITDTDADAVLILADLLDLARAYDPDAIVDVTTVGPATAAALGDDAGAVMGSDARLVEDVLAAARDAGEPLWQLPLWDHLEPRLHSPVADIVNRTTAVGGEAVLAGLALRRVVRDTPWAHIDCGSAAFVTPTAATGGRRVGATGYGTRTLLEWLEHGTVQAG
ncbi:MAG TPA: M17 family peptidase N-terminal domain-containing protein [Euzebyales bacterium]